MLTPTIQRKLDAMVQSCRIYELPPEQLELANIHIQDCIGDLLWNPGLADEIIQSCRETIEGLRVEV